MALTINEPKEITLLDGSTITVRPLKISTLRTFTKKFEELETVAEDNEKSIDVLIGCVAIALQQFKPELAADAKALEELLDLPTVYQIIKEASGYDLAGFSALIGGNE